MMNVDTEPGIQPVHFSEIGIFLKISSTVCLAVVDVDGAGVASEIPDRHMQCAGDGPRVFFRHDFPAERHA